MAVSAFAQLFFADSDDSWVEIEINESTSFSFNFSVQDAQEPTAIDVGWTYSLSLPRTKSNDDYFNNIFDFKTQLFRFSAIKKTNFVLFVNSSVFQKGYFALEEITASAYKVRLYGGLGDFFYELDQILLKDLPYGTELNFTLNCTNVLNLNTDSYNNASSISARKDKLCTFLSYQGSYDAFDPDHVVESGSVTDALWKLVSPSLTYEKSGMTENQYAYIRPGTSYQYFGIYVSYYQKFSIRVAYVLQKIIEAMAEKGWKLTLNDDFFNDKNAYYNDLWCCLGNLPVSEPQAQFELSLDDVFAYRGVNEDNNLNWRGSAMERVYSGSFLQSQNYHAFRRLRWIDGVDEECLCNIGPGYEDSTNDLDWTVMDIESSDSVWYGTNLPWNDNSGEYLGVEYYDIDLDSYLTDVKELRGDQFTIDFYLPFFLRVLLAQGGEFGRNGTVILNGDAIGSSSHTYDPLYVKAQIGVSGNFQTVGKIVRCYNNQSLDPDDDYQDYIITNMEIFDFNGNVGDYNCISRHGFFMQIYNSSRYSTQEKRSFYDSNYKEDYLFEISGQITITKAQIESGLVLRILLGEAKTVARNGYKLNWMYRLSGDNSWIQMAPVVRPVKGGYIKFFGEDVNVRTGSTLTPESLFYNNEKTCLDFLLSYAKAFNLRFTKNLLTQEIELMSKSAYYSKFSYKDAEDLSSKICYNKDLSIAPCLVNYNKGVIGFNNIEGKYETEYEESSGKRYGCMYLETGYEINEDENEFLGDTIFKTFINAIGYDACYLGRTQTTYQDDKSLPYLQDADGNAVDCLFMLHFKEKSTRTVASGLGYFVTDDEDIMYSYGFCYGVDTRVISQDYKSAVNSFVNNNENFSLYFSEPDTIYNNIEDHSGSIYERHWKKYLTDQLSKDTKVLTCYVLFDFVSDIDDLFRQFYKIENTLWILSEISGYDPINRTPTKCKFIKVQDPANYIEE